MKESIGFIGAGNMAQALIQGWLAKNLIQPTEIFVSNRTPGKLKKLSEQLQVQSCMTNEDVVEKSSVVILAIKPQDLEAAVEPIASSFTEEQIVVSLAAGIPLRKLKSLLPQCRHIVRLMANTPARVMQGVYGYCSATPNILVDRWMERMFKPMGFTIKLEEGDQFQGFAIASSSGVGFVFELMIYWIEWLEERGLDTATAQSITVHTFLGASELALRSAPQGLAELQAQVASKKGITAAGLESMRELEIERLLRYSFEKSALRDQELSQG